MGLPYVDGVIVVVLFAPAITLPIFRVLSCLFMLMHSQFNARMLC